MTSYHLSYVSKIFGGFRAVDNVDLVFRPGEIHALIGENGAGKSTLLRLLSGEHQPDGGGLLIDGREVRLTDPAKARKHGIRIVHQELSVIDSLGASENVLLGHRKKWRFFYDPRAMRKQADEALAHLNLTLPSDRKGGALSAAEQQLLEIARNTLSGPKLLILDEPTASLAQPDAERLLAIMERLRSEGTSIIFVSHRLDEVLRVADRVTVLSKGKITHRFERSDLRDAEMLIEAMSGARTSARAMGHRAQATGDPVLEVTNLTREPAFRDVSLSIGAGEIVGMTGLIGAGRSDVALALFGVTPAHSGTVLRRGRNVMPKSPKQALTEGIVLVPEDRKQQGLIFCLSSAENMTLTRRRRQARFGIMPWAEVRRRARDMGTTLSFRGQLMVPVRSCSGGNQQKVLLGRALMSEAEVVILDEPTRGVDPAAKAEIHDQIRKLARKGIGVLVISSELPEVFDLADRLLVMSEGAVTGQFEGPDYDEADVLKAAFAGHHTGANARIAHAAATRTGTR